ncbi:MAG: Rpn family recombination-promoting nuclease/putative transposase [Micrococcales bacterium]|nr:Rpn family recombination-promoting nuclease/putative transposase [Micrococcales bacterium]
MIVLRRQTRRFFGPSYDAVFRLVFGDPAHIDLLASLLSDSLELPGSQVDGLQILNPQVPATRYRSKEVVLDVLAESEARLFDLEMQNRWTSDLFERLWCYNGKMLGEQARRGAPFTGLKPVTTAVITDFSVADHFGEYHHRTVAHDHHRGRCFAPVFDPGGVHVLELPTARWAAEDTPATRWLRFIGARTEREMTMAAQSDPKIARAADLVRQYNADDATYYELIAHEKWLWDSHSRERDARQEGHHEGREEGREEERQANARNALYEGLSVEQVARITGLSVDEVTRLSAKD